MDLKFMRIIIIKGISFIEYYENKNLFQLFFRLFEFY